MLNTKIFYDNSKYFTGGYYIWALFGQTYTGDTDTVTGSVLEENDFYTGNISLLNLAAISAPIEVGPSNSNMLVYYTTETERLNSDTPTESDITKTGISYKFPSASSGVFVNRSSSTSSTGISGNCYAALYWLSSTAVNNLKIGDLTNENINAAKLVWNYKKSDGTVADLFTEIADTSTVKKLNFIGNRGTDFEFIYDSSITGVTTGSTVLNSYNYTGFTVGTLTVTLTANS